MNNFQLQKKSIERNHFNKALICAVYIVFSAFLIYSFVSCITDNNTPSMYMLSNTLYSLPFLIIFFIFFTFECCYKINIFSESISTTKKGVSSVFYNQIKVILLYCFQLYIEALIINTVYNFVNKQFSITLVFHHIIVLTVYFLLCIVTAVFIGLLLSQIKQRVLSYIVMIVIAISETNLMDSISVGIYNSIGLDTTKVIKFFNIIPCSLGWTPNLYSGYIIAFDKLSKLIFLVSLSLLFYYFKQHSNKSKKNCIFKRLLCLCVSLLALIGYIIPFSAPQMDLSASGVSADNRHYESIDQITEPADFKIESYNIKFTFNNELHATATIRTDDINKPEYKFTLYKGYKVKNIKDNSNKKMQYKRSGDYLTIYNPSHSEYIKITYYGTCDKFYSNYSSIFLPGYFAYYPVPGFNEVYSTSLYSGFQDLSLPYETKFDVTIDTLKNVYCNLEEIDKNKYSGTSNSLTLLSGFINKKTINKTVVYYPYFDNSYNADTIKAKLNGFISNNTKIKKIFVIPDINLEDIEFAKTFNDYMITASIDDIERVSFVSRISAKKMELYSATNAYYNYPEYFEFLKTNSSDELQSAIPLLEEVLKGDSDGKKLELINQYLVDGSDNRSFSELLYKMR